MLKGLRFFLQNGWKYDKRYVLWKLFHQLLTSILPIIATLAPKFIMDELLGPKRPGQLLTYTGILLGYTFIAGALSSYFDWDGFTRRCRVNVAFDIQLHERLALADFEKLESPDFLDMQAKAKKFLYCDWHGFGYLLDCALNLLGQLFTLAGIAAIIATVNPWILLLFILLTALGALVESRAKKAAMRLSEEITANQRRYTYFDSLYGDSRYGKEIRLHGLTRWLTSKEWVFAKRANQNIKRQNDGYIRSGMLRAAFSFLQQCAAYAYLLGKTAAGQLSAGSFIMYTSAVTTFSSALRSAIDSFLEISAYDLYYDRLDQYLSVPARLRENGHAPLPKGEHRICFRHVSFRYPGQAGYALRDVSLELAPGEKLGVVGENGAGKTTFVKLLTRLYDPTEGEILLDGADIRTLDYDGYLSLFSTVFQDYQLFACSLKENVSLALPQDNARIAEALRQAGLGEKLDALPNGLDTAVYKSFDPAGFEPSGGEGQKIALARALYKNAPIVVLDEPAAALDPRAEYELYQRLDRLAAGKSAVYITHRLSSAKFCDKIIVFDQGQVCEQGTHEELMALGGKYAGLFSLQAQFYR